MMPTMLEADLTLQTQPVVSSSRWVQVMRRQINRVMPHVLLCVYIGLMFIPLYLAIVAASHDGAALTKAPIPILPGTSFFNNLSEVFSHSQVIIGDQPLTLLLWNSFVMAILIGLGKVVLAALSAFAFVYFDFPFKKISFALIFLTMMLPVEVRIVSTFQLIASFGWLNSYAGLTLPLMASATATLLFRQFFKTIPSELVDAAKLDGAGPMRFFIDILMPLSKSQFMSLFIIMFIYGWNQYLWPLLITTDAKMSTMVMGIHYLAGIVDQVPQWHYVMTVSLVALFPPCLIVVLLQRWFEKGLHD